MFMSKKKILVAPLNWGLGHATRCIPIIRELNLQNFEPVLASDGAALDFLRKEFPQLKTYQLPSYNIQYARKGYLLKWKLLLNTPHILKTISEEKKVVQKIIQNEGIGGIISDNRWGARSPAIPSVFITHQVKVLSGMTTSLSNAIHKWYIQKFDELWIPDVAEEPSLSGNMGHQNELKMPVKYLGILSRFEKKIVPVKYDITAVLSGPEPQRGMLEAILMKELCGLSQRVALVRGVVEQEQKTYIKRNITVFNFLNSEELETLINSSKLIITRPGYTSIMDLARLEKQIFVIPTPGQFEQEYLAKRLKENYLATGCKQEDFKVEKLKETANFKGLLGFGSFNRLGEAFTLFQGK